MKKDTMSTAILILVFFIGLSLLLYPTVSDYWNSLRLSRVIDQYTDEVANMDTDTYDKLIQEAVEYNQNIKNRQNIFALGTKEEMEYNRLLDVSDNGIMGYIEIPVINCSLPIYHGTSESVLQIAIGHLEWSSLPVGGPGTHTLLSGHRGLPSAKLFTNLDQLVIGDTFMLQVLDETLTYEVDQILIVLPSETEELQIVDGEDYCTLITCTPYGVNSHRILVRGHRIENQEAAKVFRVTADAMQIDPMIIAPIVAAPILFVLMIWLLISTRPKRKQKIYKALLKQEGLI